MEGTRCKYSIKDKAPKLFDEWNKHGIDMFWIVLFMFNFRPTESKRCEDLKGPEDSTSLFTRGQNHHTAGAMRKLSLQPLEGFFFGVGMGETTSSVPSLWWDGGEDKEHPGKFFLPKFLHSLISSSLGRIDCKLFHKACKWVMGQCWPPDLKS